jgi:hypothetical protein
MLRFTDGTAPEHYYYLSEVCVNVRVTEIVWCMSGWKSEERSVS